MISLTPTQVALPKAIEVSTRGTDRSDAAKRGLTAAEGPQGSDPPARAAQDAVVKGPGGVPNLKANDGQGAAGPRPAFRETIIERIARTALDSQAEADTSKAEGKPSLPSAASDRAVAVQIDDRPGLPDAASDAAFVARGLVRDADETVPPVAGDPSVTPAPPEASALEQVYEQAATGLSDPTARNAATLNVKG